jgi:GT2 family glycosyltransferase
MMPKIAVQMITYGVGDAERQDVEDFFSSCARIEYPRDRWCIVVIDNPSPGGSLRNVIRERWITARHPELPACFLLEQEENNGFAGGHNAGLEASKAWGADVVFLVNQDAGIDPLALQKYVEHIAAHPQDALVQSRIMLKQEPDALNSAGNAMHYLGFGFSRGYHERYMPNMVHAVPMFYASGAAVFVPMTLIDRIGLFHSRYFMYHEDVDLSWRARLAGTSIGYCVDSVVFHRYEFSRSTKKFYWMERNRHLTNLTNYEWKTLFFMAPMMVIMECGALFFAFRGGWWREKLRSWIYCLAPSTWKVIVEQRKYVRTFRCVSDAVILAHCCDVVTHQDTKSFLVERIANPLMTWYGHLLRRVIR